MKKFFPHFLCAAVLFVAALMMTSCTKDPVEPDGPLPPVAEPTTSELILGTWDLDCAASAFHEAWVSAIDPYEYDYTASEILRSAKYIFNEDGTALLDADYYEEGSFVDTLHYEVCGDTLMFDAQEQYQITKIDRNELILDMAGTEEDPEGTYVYNVHFVLKRSAGE